MAMSKHKEFLFGFYWECLGRENLPFQLYLWAQVAHMNNSVIISTLGFILFIMIRLLLLSEMGSSLASEGFIRW